MSKKKESLGKLVKFIEEISNEPGNEWFKKDLQTKFGAQPPDISTPKDQIAHIYEYCIKEIISDQAHKFYEDLKLPNIKEQLVNDFIRMEQNKRQGDFENFCLALFQQIESITNELIKTDTVFVEYVLSHKNEKAYSIKNTKTRNYDDYTVCQLIFFRQDLTKDEIGKSFNKPMISWDFLNKLRSILYYYYFQKKIYNYFDFLSLYNIGNELYQTRNLNHRGGVKTENQIRVLGKILPASNKYYYKFLGYLEDITSKINTSIN